MEQLQQLRNEFEQLKQNHDEWVKEINSRMYELEGVIMDIYGALESFNDELDFGLDRIYETKCNLRKVMVYLNNMRQLNVGNKQNI